MTRAVLSRRAVALVAIGSSACLTLTGLAASAPAGAAAASATPPTTITVHLSANKITYSGAHTQPAGRFVFNARGKGHANTLVVLSLAKGYAKRQAAHDVSVVLGGNNAPDHLKAVRRIDHKIHWYGGTQAPGSYSVVLPAGHYLMINERPGNAQATLTVTGSTGTPASLETHGTVTAVSQAHGDRFASGSTLPDGGWISFRNKTDEPHFADFQQVKESTTRAYIRKHIQGPPSKAHKLLQAEFGTGPISPGVTIAYDVPSAAPSGKYLLVCFWPSIENGMPHAFMGMFKLLHLA